MSTAKRRVSGVTLQAVDVCVHGKFHGMIWPCDKIVRARYGRWEMCAYNDTDGLVAGVGELVLGGLRSCQRMGKGDC
jgi:hypothetical protein